MTPTATVKKTAFEAAPVTPELVTHFTVAVTAKVGAYMAKSYPTLAKPTFEAMDGPKFVRIVKVGPGERSAFCFIEKATGYILKPAGWKAPAKHARGTVHTVTFGAEYVGPYGPAYLK